MPNSDCSKLNPLQLGRYAEYFAKMEFASYGFEVYSSEVDDHGVDFIVKDKSGKYCEIKVKSLRKGSYTFMQKSKFDISNKNLFVALLIFKEAQMPEIFLIPTSAWHSPNEVFTDKNYDKEGQKSKPEYGINVSKKNYHMLELFKFEVVVNVLLNN